MTRILDAIQMHMSKALSRDERRYTDSTVRVFEDNNRDIYRNYDFAALVSRYVSATYTAASRNSGALACVPIRLYRSARGSRSRSMYRGSRVSRTRAAWLKSTGVLHGPGLKAANYAMMAGEIEEVTEHPVLELLADPNQWEQGVTFSTLFWVNLQLAGNAYRYKIKGARTGEPVSLVQFEPQWTRIVASRDDLIREYIYGRDRQIEQRFATSDIIHSKWEQDPQSPYYGRGWVKAVVVEHDIYMSINQATLTLFDRGARPDYVIRTEFPLTPEGTAQLQADIKAKYSGQSKSGAFLVIPTGVGVEPLRFPPKDTNDLAMLDKMEAVISNAAGLPEPFVRMTGASLANAETAMKVWARFTIQPKAAGEAATLTEHLLPDFAGTEGMWFAPDNVIPEDEQAKTTVMVSQTGAGIRTINEAREDAGLEPLEGGDVLRVNGVPLDSMGLPQFGFPGGLDGAMAPVKEPGEIEAPEPEEKPEPAAEQTTAGATRDFNGAQVTSAVAILQGVTDGTIAPDAAVLMLVEFFGMAEDRAGAMVAAQAARKEEIDVEAEANREAMAEQMEQEKADGNSGDVGPGDLEDSDGQGSEGKPVADAVGSEKSGVRDPRVGVDAAREAKCPHGPVRSDCACRSTRDGYSNSARQFCAECKSLANDSEFRKRTDVGMFYAAMEAFDEQKRYIIDQMRRKPRGFQNRRTVAKAGIPKEVQDMLKAWDVIDHDRWSELFRGKLQKYVDAALAEGNVAGAEQVRQALIAANKPIDPEINFGLDSSAAQEYVKRMQSQFLKDMREVSETTARKVGDSLAQSIELGEGINEQIKRVTLAFDGDTAGGESVSEFRASMIARTETAEAVIKGRLGTWAGSNAIRGKRWLLSSDACEFCRAAARMFNDKAVPLDEPFFAKGTTLTGIDGGVMVLDYRAVDGPPLHPNDKCDLVPVLIGE